MDDGRHAVPIGPERKLSREQKAGLFFVILCGFAMLLLGGQFIWASMAKPFTISYTGPRLITGAEAESAEVTKQKQTDTDSDSISDYDEMYVYKTSPYLADSDSDGLQDGAEIVSGTDPNCTNTDDCGGVLENEDSMIASSAGETFLGEDVLSAGESTAYIQQAIASLQGLTDEDIRQLLLDAGADEELMEDMSDAEIRTLYNELLMDLADSGALGQITQQVVAETATTQP